jgi:hypothetical protein
MSSKKTLILIAFLLFALAGSLFLVFKTTIFFGKAAVQNNTLSTGLGNSYLFASPLQAKADSQEKIRLVVFLLDNRGFGIQNQKVDLKTPSGLTQTPIQPTTDDTGKATFDVSARSAGKFVVSASVASQTLPQKITLNFY